MSDDNAHGRRHPPWAYRRSKGQCHVFTRKTVAAKYALSAKIPFASHEVLRYHEITTPAPPLNEAHPGGFLFCASVFHPLRQRDRMQYNKPPLVIMDQIALLQQRGMVFANVDEAQHILAHINYYRLRPYWLPFEDVTDSAIGQNGQHFFQTGTSFEAVLVYYTFDQRLKLLLMDAIERVEISLRTHWAHELALRYGSHAYLNVGLFCNTRNYAKCLESLQYEVRRSHEAFIKHYLDTYSHPNLPPIWAICEVMSLGQLSQWLSNLKHRKDRQAIVHAFGFDEKVICTFAHHLATVRNLCAHHSRVWNRRFTIRMKLPHRTAESAHYFNAQENQKVYNTLLMLVLLLDQICPGSTWKVRLLKLIATMPGGTAAAMGYPEEWMNMAVWARSGLEI